MKPQKTAFIGILINLIIFIFKFFSGMMINSIAIIADSFNNLADSISNLTVILGIQFAQKPADADHPFGHERIEYLASLIISMLMVFTGVQFFASSFSEIQHPSELNFNRWVILILITTIIIKYFLYKYYQVSAKKNKSQPLKALAIDKRNDILVTSFAVLSIGIAYFFGVNVDGFAGMGISLFIVYSGVMMAKETISKLLGEAVDQTKADEIQSFVSNYENILGSHDLIVHTYGPKRTMATLHVDMPNTLLLEEAHNIIDKIERDIKKELEINLVLHIDPVATEDPRLPILKDRVNEYLRAINKHIEIHDFRIIDKDEVAKIIFELVFPHAFDKEMEGIIVVSLDSIIRGMDETYQPIIEPKYKFIRE